MRGSWTHLQLAGGTLVPGALSTPSFSSDWIPTRSRRTSSITTSSRRVTTSAAARGGGGGRHP